MILLKEIYRAVSVLPVLSMVHVLEGVFVEFTYRSIVDNIYRLMCLDLGKGTPVGVF